jgi:protein-L-isoaspartate(D-aspartate) O-methyltransferase
VRDLRLQRERLVKKLAERGISDPVVLDAIRAVPRERFVEEALRMKAYADAPLPIGGKQTISQPWIVARMTELLEPDGTGRVLEIGSGSGYQAAVLASLFEQVYSVERIPDLSRRALRTIRDLGIENVFFKIFDGTYGWGEFAPYRGILVTAGAPDVPQPLIDQLADGGRLVLPLATDSGPDGDQVLVRLRKRGRRVIREDHGLCRFVPLIGKFGWRG